MSWGLDGTEALEIEVNTVKDRLTLHRRLPSWPLCAESHASIPSAF
jgi:hypothetical protein